MSNVLRIANLTVTNGNAVVTVNSVEVLTKFKAGDVLFVANNLPLVVQSIAGQNITLTALAPYSASNVEGVLMASNVNLRDALDKIQENNNTWSRYFAPYLIWMASTNDTEPLEDSQGNVKQVRTPYKLDQMADNINTAAVTLGTLEDDVDALTATVNSQQATLDAARNAAITAKDDAEAAETRIGTVETNINTKHTEIKTYHLGTFAVAPTTDNDGNPLIEGAEYFSSTDDVTYHWDGSAWNSEQLAAAASATTASNAATAATTQAGLATNAWNDFKAINLGRHATAPTTDLESNPLQDGMSYTNTTLNTYNIRVNGAWVDVIAGMTTKVSEAEAARDTALVHRDAAETAKDVALAAANYKGEWANQTGAANIPYAVSKNNGIFMLLNNVADVTTSDPEVDTGNWGQIASIGGVATDAAKLGGNLPSHYATAASVAAITLNSLGAEPAFVKNTAHNKNFGTGSGDVAVGDHTHTDLQAGINKARILALAAL